MIDNLEPMTIETLAKVILHVYGTLEDGLSICRTVRPHPICSCGCYHIVWKP